MQHVTTVILNALHKNYSFITCRSKMEKTTTTTKTLHALRRIELLSQLKILSDSYFAKNALEESLDQQI